MTTLDLTIQPFDWETVEAQNIDPEDNVNIHCWALNRNSEPVLIRYVDFPATAYIELPMYHGRQKIRWSQTSVDLFMEDLVNRLGGMERSGIRAYNFRMAKKTYYYRGDMTNPMILVQFNNTKCMKMCTYTLTEHMIETKMYGHIKCHVWEHDISTIRKLLTIQDTKFSQWYNVTATKVEIEDKISKIENEYIGYWGTIKAVPVEETKLWKTEPKMLAFDIECYSDNRRAMPDKYNANHVAYMISCIFQKYRHPETRRRYGIVIGDCNHIPKEKLDECTIIKVDSELEMVDEMSKVMNQLDPDIITGYNILGFDYPYLDHRVKRWLKSWPDMGRIIGEKASMNSKVWNSGAYGYQSINYLKVSGRISIDLLPIIRRDFKLDRYNLDTVAKKFLGRTKHDVSAPEMFLIYEEMRKSLTTVVHYKKYLQEHPEVKDNPEFRQLLAAAEEKFEKDKADTTRVLEYCIQDSELVIDLMEKLDIWIGLVEMSNIVGVTIVELFTRGQQVRCLSLLYDLASKSGYIIDSRDTPGFKYSGGFVFDPVPGLFDNVICLDFSSLYPSIIRAYNICYTTLIKPEHMDAVPDEDCNVIEFDQEEDDNETGAEEEEDFLVELNTKKKKVEKKITKHYKFKWYKKQEGLLPRLVGSLVAERRAVNRQLGGVKSQLSALDKLENLLIMIKRLLNREPILTVEEANSIVKRLSNSTPPAEPEVISAAKKNEQLAELTVLSIVEEKRNKAIADKAIPELLTELNFEVKVAKAYQVQDYDQIQRIHDQICSNRDERLYEMNELALLSTMLDKRQLALKVTANSFYGFLGVQNGGKMPLIEGAMSVTGRGRFLINEVSRYIENKYGGKQVAGDTDSCMFQLPNQIKSSKDCNYWGKRLAEEISGIKPGEKDCDGVLCTEGRPGLFPPPLAMEFEKAMRLVVFRKKKYAALLISKDGKFKMEDITDKAGNKIGEKPAVLIRGIVLARRDNCIALRELYMKILDIILKQGDFGQAVNILFDTITDLLNGRIPYEKLVIVRGLGDNYKSDSYFMKVFADDLKKAGKIVNPGDRLDFLIVEDPNAKLLGHKMKLIDQYLESQDTPTPYKIDYNYYISKVLMNPLNQLIEVGFKDTIEKLPHVYYKASNRHKIILLNEIMKMIVKMIERNFDINNLRLAIHYNLDKLKQEENSIQLIINQIAEQPHLQPQTPLQQTSLQLQPQTPLQQTSLQLQPQTPLQLQPQTPLQLQPQTPLQLQPQTPKSISTPKPTPTMIPPMIIPPMIKTPRQILN